MTIAKHDFDSSSDQVQAGFTLNQLEDLIDYITTNKYKPTSQALLTPMKATEHVVINIWHPMCPDITELYLFCDEHNNWWPYKLYDPMSDITTQTQLTPFIIY